MKKRSVSNKKSRHLFKRRQGKGGIILSEILRGKIMEQSTLKLEKSVILWSISKVD